MKELVVVVAAWMIVVSMYIEHIKLDRLEQAVSVATANIARANIQLDEIVQILKKVEGE